VPGSMDLKQCLTCMKEHVLAGPAELIYSYRGEMYYKNGGSIAFGEVITYKEDGEL